jgi:hypothetical protein
MCLTTRSPGLMRLTTALVKANSPNGRDGEMPLPNGSKRWVVKKLSTS